MLPAITRSTVPHIKFQSILAAIDFGPLSKELVHHAAALAQSYSAELYLMHVVPSRSSSSLLPERATEENAWKNIRAIEQTLISKRASTGCAHYLVVRKGDVWDQLEDVIVHQRIDLVVLGVRNQARRSDTNLGSVAEQVLRNSRCPVLAIDPSGIVPELTIKRLVFATDFSDASLDALPYAIGLANHHHAQLVLAHVLRSISCDRKPLLEKTTGMLTKYVPDIEPEIREISTEPVETILKVAEDVCANGVVLGFDLSSLADAHVEAWRSTAYQITSRARCPVVTFRTWHRAMRVH